MGVNDNNNDVILSILSGKFLNISIRFHSKLKFCFQKITFKIERLQKKVTVKKAEILIDKLFKLNKSKLQ